MVNYIDNIYSLRYKNKLLERLRIYSFIRFLIRLFANIFIPIYYLLTCNKKNSLNVDKKREQKIVVSLTSFPNRINRLWLVIESLLRQSFKPDRIILWLSINQFESLESLPKRLLKQQLRGLEIRICNDDLKSHKKYYYAIKEFPGDIIVTFDDDVFYSPHILKYLVKLNTCFPNSICCNTGYFIKSKNGKLLEYDKWEQLVDAAHPDFNVFFTGVGGVLYPPQSLNNIVLDRSIFEIICKDADDIWLKAASLLNNSTVAKTSYYSNYLPVLHLNNSTLMSKNVMQNGNDIQLNSVRNYFIKKIGIDPFQKCLNK